MTKPVLKKADNIKSLGMISSQLGFKYTINKKEPINNQYSIQKVQTQEFSNGTQQIWKKDIIRKATKLL